MKTVTWIAVPIFLCISILGICFGQSNFWEPASGNFGNVVTALAVAPSGELYASTLITGTMGSRVLVSSDHGKTWTLQSTLPYLQIHYFAVNAKGFLFVGPSSGSAGLFRSNDKGVSWTQCGGSPLYLSALARDCSDNIYAGCNGTFRSTDDGNTWQTLNTTAQGPYSIAHGTGKDIFIGSGSNEGDPYISGMVFRSTDEGGSWFQVDSGYARVQCIVITKPGTILAGTGGVWGTGVQKSTDRGDTWHESNSGLTSTGIFSISVGSKGNIFAGSEGGIGHLYRSTDDGGSWTELSVGFNGSGAGAIVTTSIDGFVYVADGASPQFYRSSDNGNTWEADSTGIATSYKSCIAADKAGDLFLGCTKGVYRSTNRGNDWTPKNNGLTNTEVNFSLAVTSSGNMFVGTARGGGVFRSTNRGDNWQNCLSGTIAPHVYGIALNPDENVFVLVEGGVSSLFRSTDAGDSWTPLSGGFNAITFPSCREIVGVSSSEDVPASGKIYRSTDDGDTWWTSVNPTGLEACGTTYSLATGRSGRLFLGAYNGVYRSTDGGSSWARIGSLADGSSVYGLLVIPSGEIFLSCFGNDPGVWRSRNDGDSWDNISAGLFGRGGPGVNALGIDSTGYLFAVNPDAGVFRSVERALPIELADFNAAIGTGGSVQLRWSTISEANNYGFEVQKAELPQSGFSTIPNSFLPGHGTTIETHHYYFVDNTPGTGRYYRLKQIDLDGSLHYSEAIAVNILGGVADAQMPASFVLEQNYPNPFNPSTTMRYGLPQGAKVNLTMYNTLGQQVATLVKETQEAGYHEVKFDGSGLASGVYIYRLQAGNFVQTRKLLLLR